MNLNNSLKYPILLVHGFAGFDEIGITGYKKSYFRGIKKELEKYNIKVYKIKTPPISSIKKRAIALKEQIEKLPENKFNIIAHSLGGIDARYAIKKLGIADKIASLTTISSPHHGSYGAFKLHQMLNKIGINLKSLELMSENNMTRFNQKITANENVKYFCVTASVKNCISAGPLALTYLYLKRRVGDNDGILSESSQVYGEELFHINAHHWAQIGWWCKGFNAADIYEEIINHLIKKDF